MTGPFAMVAALVVLGVPTLLLLLLNHRLRPVERREVEELAYLADLEVTTGNVGLLVASVARTRIWRTMGVMAAGIAVVAVMTIGVLRGDGLDLQLIAVLWLLVGYWGGSVVAELVTARNAPGDGPRVASLVRRERSAYVAPWASTWPRRLAVAGALGTVVSFLLGVREWSVLSFGVGAVAVAVVDAAVARYVLERPRPALDDDVAAADDAVRSRSLHALGGATVGIGIWTASISVGTALLVYVLGDDPARWVSEYDQTAAVVLLVSAVVVPMVGVLVGRRLGSRRFAVRPHSTSEASA